MFAITPGTRSISGWVGGTRTPNLRFKRPLLYPFSYDPELERPGGLEPPSTWFEARSLSVQPRALWKRPRESNPDLLSQIQAS